MVKKLSNDGSLLLNDCHCTFDMILLHFHSLLLSHSLSPSLNIHPTFNLEIFSFSFSHSITTPYVECNRPTTLYTLTSIDDVIRFYSIRSCIGVCICSFSLPSINILESIYTKGKRTHTHTHTRTTT